MGLQKYRADVKGQEQTDGATPWFANWMGGPTLALVRAVPTPWGPRTVYVTGEADTWFSLPAACTVKRQKVTGYLTTEERNGVAEYVFRPHTESAARLNEWLAAKGEKHDAET